MGCFVNIGLFWFEVLGFFVGVVEMVCGVLIILGLVMCFVFVFLIIVMFVVIVLIKVFILLGYDVGIFYMFLILCYGFWSMVYEVCNDFCMLFVCLYLLIVGVGLWLLDYVWCGCWIV